MDDQLTRLEQKILETVALIQDLRQENTRLREHTARLEDEIKDLHDQRTALERQLESAREVASAFDIMKGNSKVSEIGNRPGV